MNKDFRIEFKSVSEDGTFEGLLSVYNIVDLGGDLIEPGAFTKTLAEKGPVFPMLWQHETKEPIGTLEVTDTGEGLSVKGRFALEVQRAKEAYALVKNKVISGLSIGYRVVKKKSEGGVRHLKEIELYEGSVVTFPMNMEALISSVKADGEKADFATELQLAQTYAMRGMMMQSICYALDSIVWDYEMDAQAKIDESEASIEQFRKSYVAFLPELLKAWGEIKDMPVKTGRRISGSTRKEIEGAVALLQALLAEEESSEEGTPKGAAPAIDPLQPEAAPPTDKPDAVHLLGQKLDAFHLALSAL